MGCRAWFQQIGHLHGLILSHHIKQLLLSLVQVAFGCGEGDSFFGQPPKGVDGEELVNENGDGEQRVQLTCLKRPIGSVRQFLHGNGRVFLIGV